MKTKKFLLLVVMQILVVLPLVAQELYTELEREMFGEPSELFINDIVAKPIKASTLNAKDGDTINDYQVERQFIDNYMKQINPNFSAGNLRVIVDLINDQHLVFDVIYKQIPVDGYDLTLHPLSDTTYVIMGANLFSNDISIFAGIPSSLTFLMIASIKVSSRVRVDGSSSFQWSIRLDELRFAGFACVFFITNL